MYPIYDTLCMQYQKQDSS